MFNMLPVQKIGLGLKVGIMSKKLGKCSGCKQQLVVGHVHLMSGGRLCDDCYPYAKDAETGKLVYKRNATKIGEPHE
jgi:recombinational DNA repair protein (RecF pathway)